LNQRMREVGIRIAVGASSGNIAALFAREAIVIVLLGTAIGIPLALAAASLLKSQLFGVTPHDPAILFACLGCVLTTVLLAAIAPLRRANAHCASTGIARGLNLLTANRQPPP
jgi:putative ABC transport system permease protein